MLLSIINGIPFLTASDEIHFCSSIACVCLLSVLSWIWQSDVLGSEACIYALCVLADAIYRTPENPYAGIFCVIFAINQWQKILVLCVFSPDANIAQNTPRCVEKIVMKKIDNDKKTTTHTAIQEHKISKIINLVLTTFFMCLSIQTGLVPQFIQPEDWPIYGGVGAYVTFATAWYKARSAGYHSH